MITNQKCQLYRLSLICLKKCFFCGSKNVVMNGLRGRKQLYKCKDCGRQFFGGHRRDKSQVISDYVDRKQTIEQLACVFASCGAMRHAKIPASLKIQNGTSGQMSIPLALCFSVQSVKLDRMIPHILATFSRNGLTINGNILKVKKLVSTISCKNLIINGNTLKVALRTFLLQRQIHRICILIKADS